MNKDVHRIMPTPSHFHAAAEHIGQAISHITDAIQADVPVRRGIANPRLEELQLLVRALGDIHDALVEAMQQRTANSPTS